MTDETSGAATGDVETASGRDGDPFPDAAGGRCGVAGLPPSVVAALVVAAVSGFLAYPRPPETAGNAGSPAATAADETRAARPDAGHPVESGRPSGRFHPRRDARGMAGVPASSPSRL